MKEKSSLVVIILTWNEAIHIRRCIESLIPLGGRLIVVDSHSTDETVEIARGLGAEVVSRSWKNYADQFQWALDNYSANAEWIMRMDADEYIESDLQCELRELLSEPCNEISGFYFNRKVFFNGQWMRRGGTYPQWLLRVWRAGRGRIEQRWMDEHVVMDSGSRTMRLRGGLVDDNRKGIGFWVGKCNGYATREMVDLLNVKYCLFPRDTAISVLDDPQAKWKRFFKDKCYANLPPALRALAYFAYRYVIRFGFLDGVNGFLWHFMQGCWYRLLVDVKVIEAERLCGGDVTKLKVALKDFYGIDL